MHGESHSYLGLGSLVQRNQKDRMRVPYAKDSRFWCRGCVMYQTPELSSLQVQVLGNVVPHAGGRRTGGWQGEEEVCTFFPECLRGVELSGGLGSCLPNAWNVVPHACGGHAGGCQGLNCPTVQTCTLAQGTQEDGRLCNFFPECSSVALSSLACQVLGTWSHTLTQVLVCTFPWED